MTKARSPDGTPSQTHLRVNYRFSKMAAPLLWQELTALEQSGVRGAVGERMTYLANLGLQYERQMGQTPDFPASQPVDSKGIGRVRVPQRDAPDAASAAGETGADVSPRTGEKDGSQAVDSTANSGVPVAQWSGDEPSPMNPARSLAADLVGRGNGFGRIGRTGRK